MLEPERRVVQHIEQVLQHLLALGFAPADAAAAGHQGGYTGGHDQGDLVCAIRGIGAKHVNGARQHQDQENDGCQGLQGGNLLVFIRHALSLPGPDQVNAAPACLISRQRYSGRSDRGAPMA